MIALLLSLALAAEPALPTGVPAAPEGPNPFLAQAKELFGKLEFEKCVQRLKQAPQWKSSPVELKEIEIYAGMCHYNLNQRGDAEERFRLALRIDEGTELPEYSSPKLVEFFLWVKKRMRSPPPPFPTEDLPPDAPTQTELTPAERAAPHKVPVEATQPSKSILVRYPAAVALSVVAIAALAVGVGLGANAKSLEARAKAATFDSEYRSAGDAAKASAIGANVSFGIAGLAVGGAVLSIALSSD